MIRVLIVDDHSLVRAGLDQLIGSQTDMQIVGSAANGEEAVAAAAAVAPDVVLMDLSMPRMDGIEATRRILTADPAVQVLVLTSFSDRERVMGALNAGAVGYLLKDSEPEQLLGAIRETAGGGSPLDRRITRTVVTERRRPASKAGLTEREREVLTLLRNGLANKQIARRLGISEATVKTHLGNAYLRIGVTDRTTAALWVREHLADGH